MQRKRVRLAAAADTAAVEEIIVDIPEIQDVMDASLENVDSAVYSVLKEYNPKMMPFTVRLHLPEVQTDGITPHYCRPSLSVDHV